MQGQDAINTAKAFKEALPLTGVVLTKLDGDSRGGAALSVRQVTGAPIKFAGVSREDRRAGGLRRRAPRRPRARHGRHRRPGRGGAAGRRPGRRRRSWPTRSRAATASTSNDFLAQISQMKKMGGLSGPDGQAAQPARRRRPATGADMDRAERDVRRMEGIICSMTPLERRKPELHQGHAASAASPPAPACRCRKSTACSSSSSRCRT